QLLVSVEVELVELPVLGQYAAHGPGDRAHHDGFGFNHVLAEFNAAEHRTSRDAGGGKKAIAPNHILDLVFLLRILDAHLYGARPSFLGASHRACLLVTANTTERRRRQHTFRRAADAEINVDAGFRIGAMNDTGDIAITDEAHRGAGLADRRNDVRVPRPVEQ